MLLVHSLNSVSYLPGKACDADINNIHLFIQYLFYTYYMSSPRLKVPFPDKGPLSQSYGFSSSHVRMWESDHKEGWAPKNWCFKLWCWEDSWESLGLQGDQIHQPSRKSTIKEGLMLKLQNFRHLMWRANSLEKTLMLGKKTGGDRNDRGWDGWMASLTQWTWAWANSGRWWRTGNPGMLQSTGHKESYMT